MLTDDTGSSNTDYATSNGEVTFSGTVTDAGGTGIDSVVVYKIAGLPIGNAVVTGNTWTLTTTLGTGVWNAPNVIVTDHAGNASAALFGPAIYVDQTPPLAFFVSAVLASDTGSNGADLITSIGTVDFSGAVAAAGGSPIGSIEVFDNTISLGFASGFGSFGGNWTFTTALQPGVHDHLSIVATDVAGNETSPIPLGQTIIVDQTAPLIAITSSGGATIFAAQTVTGTGEPGTIASLFLDGATAAAATAVVGSDGHWSTTVALGTDGAHTIVATDTDAAGNVGSSTGVTFTLDRTPPHLVSIAQSDPSLTNANAVHYTVTFSETVTGVDASQFALAGSGVSGASIAGVTPVSGSNGTQYTVAVNTGTGDGTIALELTGTGIHDLAGNGLPGGTFPLDQPVPGIVGNYVTSADLNSDGRADLVVESSANTISVLLGNGDGMFQMAVAYAVSNGDVGGISIGDVDSDGNLDVIVSKYNGSGTVSTLLGNGDGTLQAQIESSTGSSFPAASAIADVDGDGRPDLIVANTANRGGVSILLGNGDGTFTPLTVLASNGDPIVVATADLNGDGAADVAFANAAWGAHAVQVYLNNADGTFHQAPEVQAGGNTIGVAFADFNGDGKQDLVFSGDVNAVSVALGNGDGTFHFPVAYTVGASPGGVQVGDVNGDGRLDLVVANGGSNDVSVLLGNGDGTFQPQTQFAAGSGPGLVGLPISTAMVIPTSQSGTSDRIPSLFC